MIRCVAPRDGSSVKLLTAIGRRYRSATFASPDQHDDAQGASTQRAEATEALETLEEAGHAIKEPGILTTKPLRRRELPISPFMDPKYISAKEKHKAPKPPPSKNPTELQRLLAKNPYALALATPVRACRATSVVLPRYFLQDFNLMAHPESGKPWWMPKSLASKYTYPPSGEEDIDGPEPILEDSELDNGTKLDMEETEMGNVTKPGEPAETIDSSLESPPPPSRSVGPGAYVLARQRLLAEFEGKGFLNQGHLVPRNQGSSHRSPRNSNIRPDISTFVLELLRRRLVEELEYLVSRRAYVGRCTSWEDAKKPSRQVGAILWASPVIEGEKLTDVDGKSQTAGPPEFAIVDIGTVKKRKVPVHNLDMLLGQEHLQALREFSSIFKGEVLTIRHKKLTIDVQLQLWRLQGYMAEHKPLSEEDQSQETED